MTPEQTQQQIGLDLSNYSERKKKELISWKKENGAIFLVIKQRNNRDEFEETRIPFSSIQIGKRKNEVKQRILDREQQILDLQQQNEDENMNFSLFDEIEKDIKEIETEKGEIKAPK